MRPLALIAALSAIVTGCGAHAGVNLTRASTIAPAATQSDHLALGLVLAILTGILGVGVGVFFLVWSPFKKVAIAEIVGSGAIIGACLLVRAVLPYMGWVALGAALIGIGLAIWKWRRLSQAAAVAWSHVDDGVIVSSAAEAVLNRLPIPLTTKPPVKAA